LAPAPALRYNEKWPIGVGTYFGVGTDQEGIVMATQQDIAKRVGIDISSVNKILNHRPGATFRKETVRKVFKIARELGYDLTKLRHRHHREHARKDVSLPLEVSIYLEDGSLFDRGRGTLRNVSLSGAVLSGIVLPQQSVPLRSHRIGIRITDGPLADTEFLGRPIRFIQVDGGIGLAIEFVEKAERIIKQLKKII
jgi:transcriptional regulator with XRE-family HTH domain